MRNELCSCLGKRLLDKGPADYEALRQSMLIVKEGHVAGRK